MATLAPVMVVDAPAPVPRPYRLLDIAGRIPEQIDRYLAGISQVRYPVVVADLSPIQGCPGPGSTAFVKEATLDPGTGEPHAGFAVIAGIECGGVALTDRADFESRLRQVFDAVQSAGVENELLTGVAAAQPSLASEAVTVGTAGMGVVAGLARLEHEYADRFAAQPTIHLSPRLAIIAKTQGLLEVPAAGNQPLRSILGSPVIPGAGYTDTDKAIGSPDGNAPAANIEWAYASGAIQYRATSLDTVGDQIADFLDRETNDARIFIERGFALSWDEQTVLAVNINRTL